MLRYKLSGPMRDTPRIAQCLFRDSIAEGGYRTHFALVSCGIARVSLQIPPSVGGGGGWESGSTSHALQWGTAQKRGSHPIGHVETPQTQ